MTEEKRQMDMGDRILYYTLCRKKIRNVNLRIHRDGSIVVSAPLRVPIGEIERILRLRASWMRRCYPGKVYSGKRKKRISFGGRAARWRRFPGKRE